ncbi:MAG: hypothetical protein AB7E70_07910 [Hyphomicrobiaceae bacterium]
MLSHVAGATQELADDLRRLLNRLSAEGTVSLFGLAKLPTDGLADQKPRNRVKIALDRVGSAPFEVRDRIELISSEVMVLADRAEYAETALRKVCESKPHLLEILEQERSLEERILTVWIRGGNVLDRARNLAMAFIRKDGRSHCGFRVGGQLEPSADHESVARKIKDLVQARQGGRRVYFDHFPYRLDDASGSGSEGGDVVYHFGFNLEAPAQAWREFTPDSAEVATVVRREAKELSIDYNPRTGVIDVVGKGVGGGKVLQDIALAFSREALAGAEIELIKRKQWQLERFIDEHPPLLSPPEGFRSVRVVEIASHSQRRAGAKAVFRSGVGQSAYDRMKELGVRSEGLLAENVGSVTLAFEKISDDPERPPREIRATLKLPNALSYEGASSQDKQVISDWAEQQPFAHGSD